MLRETISSLRLGKKDSCIACMKSKEETDVPPTLVGCNRDWTHWLNKG